MRSAAILAFIRAAVLLGLGIVCIVVAVALPGHQTPLPVLIAGIVGVVAGVGMAIYGIIRMRQHTNRR